MPVPTIDMAVMMRDLSALKERAPGRPPSCFGAPPRSQEHPEGDSSTARKRPCTPPSSSPTPRGWPCCRGPRTRYGYGLDLEAVARIWRGGCIIRAALLEEIRRRLSAPARPAQPAARPGAGRHGRRRARTTCGSAVAGRRSLGIPAPGLMACPGLFRRLAQRPAAGQPDPGPARLLRRPHLRADRCRGDLPHRMGTGVRPP